MSDPRLGLPSGSQMARLAKCPGSLALTNLLQSENKIFERYDPARMLGVKIHAWLAAQARGQQFRETLIRPDEVTLAFTCSEMARNLIIHFFDCQPEECEQIVEQRFWYRNGFKPYFSAQADYTVIKGTEALLIDYKTGRSEAEESADNLQLRTEVVLFKKFRPELTTIRAAIIEPFVSWESQIVEYDSSTFAQAEAEILEIVNAAQWHKDERHAGAWCKYCPARSRCNEALQYVQTLPNIDPEKAIKELPRGEAGTRFWEKLKLAEKLIETWQEAYKLILEQEPDALPGYILPEVGYAVRFVPDPAKFKAALAEYLTSEEIDGCAEYNLLQIQEILALKMKLSAKDAKTLLTNVARHHIGTKNNAPFIRKLNKSERQSLDSKSV